VTKCPLCGCATHRPAQTWEVTCARCGQLKWPQAVDRPGPDYVCALCAMTPPAKAATRKAAARKRADNRLRSRPSTAPVQPMVRRASMNADEPR
jgi:hypothetical protein